MFDCGEASSNQLCDHYGEENYQQILLSLRVLFISHIHGDHNLGMIDLIVDRNKAMQRTGCMDKLFVIVPANVVTWIDLYCRTF